MKILVHLHLFYQDMLPEMLTLLRSLDGYEYDLFATVVNASPETLAELRRFKPEVTVIDVENRGYDVAPFVRVLQLADLSRYDYVIKLHTKQNLKRRAWLKNVSFTGSGWRRLLVSFMASSEQLRRTLALFRNPETGMVSHYNLIIEAEREDRLANARADKMLAEMGLRTEDRRFVAGTMFIVRAELLRPLKDYPCRMSDFEPYNGETPGGTLAHVYERLFGFVVTAQGQKIVSCEEETGAVRFGHLLRRVALAVGRTVLQIKVNRKNRLIVKVFKIPLCSWRLRA